MLVEVYKNLHKNCWSVRHKGKVIDHTRKILLNHCELVVRAAGNKRVREEKRKNVHAFIRGRIATESDKALMYKGLGPDESLPWEEIRYNPYTNTAFVNSLGIPVHFAEWVELDLDIAEECNVNPVICYGEIF